MNLLYVFVLMVLFCSFSSAQSSHVPAALNSQVEKIRIWASDEVIVKAVQAQNKEGLSLERIKQLDREWIRATEPTAEMKALIGNECSARLRQLSSSLPALIESFVMDAQGANVCLTQRTSDYWQGDEAKWSDAFNEGKGDVVISQRQYDESSKSTLVHVSVPIMENEKAIGVITCGINLGKLAESTSKR